MAMVFCEDCGEKVSTDATACPHCGKPREDKQPAKGWLSVFITSAFVTHFAVLTAVVTLVGGVITFLHQRYIDLDRLKLSQIATTRESKRAFLELQLETYRSVLGNVASLYTIYTLNKLEDLAKGVPTIKPDPSVSYEKLIRSFVSDYDTRMAFVEDLRTEVAMEIVNVAIQAPGHPPWLPNVDPKKCSLIDVTPVLAHCMKLSIAESWDFPAEDQKRRDRQIGQERLADDYCNLEQVAQFAAVCRVELSSESKSEFQKITASRNVKNIPPPKGP